MKKETLFEQHLSERLSILEHALAVFELDGLVLSAGSDRYYYQDDQEIPFRSSHHFSHYCPVQGAGHAVVLAPGKKPVLFYFCPEDYWYDHSSLEDAYWTACFEHISFPSRESLWKALSEYKSYGFLGPENDEAREHGFEPASEAFQHHLNWHRAYKSPYEAYCLDKATEIASRGHRTAKATFLQGGSELDIHLAYLSAIRMAERDLPYTAIIGLDEKAAILHYSEKRDAFRNGRVLLIDSGAKYCGYGSDITRTYTCPEAATEFSSMLEAMNREQMALCSSIHIGMNFGDLTHASHLAIGRVLLEHGVLKGIGLDEAVENGLTSVFYPHGIGHMLGILVHDIGSKQIDMAGGVWVKDEDHPTKTRMRTIEAGFLFTVEPGLYFMEMLLNPHRDGEHNSRFNWELIDRLLPFGGMRFEDNIYVTDDEVRNITRQHLP